MNKRLLSKLLSIITLLFLAACNGPVECIDPDNWGNQYKMTVDSKGKDVTGSTQNTDYQYSEWSWKYRLNGRDIIMIIDNPPTITKEQTIENLNCAASFNYSNTWAPLFGDYRVGTPNNPADDSLTSVPLARFVDKTPPKWCTAPPNIARDVPVLNIPSRFYMGMGLYASIGDNPNTGSHKPPKDSMSCGFNGVSPCVAHIGDNACEDLTTGCNTGFFSYGCPTGGAILKPPSMCGPRECYLYMKILDRYYDDNTGSYTVTFKQGVEKDSLQPISKAVAIVTSNLCTASAEVYKNVTQSSLVGYVKILLILYIMFAGIGFLLGMVEMTNTELIIRIFKIGIILQLVSDSSWEFFNMYLFNIFQNGVGELTGILFGGSGSSANTETLTSLTSLSTRAVGCVPNVSGFQQFDDAILKIFSYETSRKVLSLLVWSPYGFIFIAIIYVAIAIIFLAIAQAVLIFIVSYLTTSLLIILAPIFIPFMLFKFTKKFTDNWLKQLISYFIQPLVILTFAFFVLTLILNQLQFLVGYRVCWKEWFKIPLFNTSIYAWQKDFDNRSECLLTPNTIFDFNEEGNITIASYPGPSGAACTPMVHSASTGTPPGNIKCDPYVCPQKRYLGYPYLDPTKEADVNRINELQNGELISFMDMVIFILLIYFIMKFNKVVPLMAKNLADAEYSSGDISDVAGAMQGKVLSVAQKVAYTPTNMAYRKATGRESLAKDFKTAKDVAATTIKKYNPATKLYSGLNTAAKAPFTQAGKAVARTATLPVKASKAVGGKIAEVTKKGMGKILRK